VKLIFVYCLTVSSVQITVKYYTRAKLPSIFYGFFIGNVYFHKMQIFQSAIVSLIVSLFILQSTVAQDKKRINQDSYFEWSSVSGQHISTNGNYIWYSKKHLWANDTVEIIDNIANKTLSFARAKSLSMDFNEQFASYTLVNDYDSTKKLELDEVPRKKWPQDTTIIFSFKNDTSKQFVDVDGVYFGDEGGEWLLIHRSKDFKLPVTPSKKKKCKLFKKKNKAEIIEDKELGTILTLYNPTKDSMYHIQNVAATGVNFYGDKAYYSQTYTVRDSIDSTAISVLDLNTMSSNVIYENQGVAEGFSFDRSGNQFVFYASLDTGDYKKFQIYRYASESTEMIIDSVLNSFASHQSVSNNASLQFSRDGKRLFFGVGNRPFDPGKDTIIKSEKYKLDLWSWTDGRMMPQQLLSAKRDKKSSADFVYNIKSKSIIQIQDTSLNNVKYYNHRNSAYALELSQVNYLKEMTYDYWYFDYLRVDLNTGEKDTLLMHSLGYNGNLSPSGKFLTYFQISDSAWYLLDIDAGETANLTGSINDRFYAKNWDMAQGISPSGRVYWTEGEQSVLVFSQSDLWVVPVNGGKPYRFTKGKETDSRFSYLRLDMDEVYINFNKGFYLKSFNEKTKQESVWHYGVNGIERLMIEDAKVFSIKKAKNAEQVIFKKMTFTSYPDLFQTDLTFKKHKQITDVNPQQDLYNWGTVELVHWLDYKGDSVEGLLYQPENLDTSKKYPMIVYYYDRSSDGLHNYSPPRPSASVIHPTEYVSNGYTVFIPNISYEIGHPANSAYNAIMSGTDFVLENYKHIDSTKMGLQGQSWGGYQTAQLITMTNRYAAAMAGAPVSNMISAYGGIRWGSGLSRAFQYETGQSRIGTSIWKAPELYIENSPIFHLHKVNTPLLIMHNDGDGAVPWYQGIEMFSGLRRLNKPSWLLNYNDDQHNLMKIGNRMDLSKRMMQFFDYYLQEQGAPEWLIYGLPAIYKGEKTGY
jgi:dipeptidyl aminopeptidase/acylaminoacyl peptidase